MATYEEFQNLEVSEKIILVMLQASRRLMGWSLYSGSIYEVDFTERVIEEVQEDGTELAEVSSLGAIAAGKYFNDTASDKLYMQATDSSHPNGKYIAVTYENFFSNVGGVYLPHDLSTGFDVHWLPYVKSTSAFGVGLDNKEYLGFAIEGSGSVEFLNAQDYWQPRFDKWYWDNQLIRVYSWNRSLPATEAEQLYRGLTQKKSYSAKSIKFSLKDTFKTLRQPIELDDLVDFGGAVVRPNLETAKQRLVYGVIRGHIPSNISQTLPDGNAITGTATVVNASTTVTGAGTSFFSELSPDDTLVFGDDTTNYTVLAIASNTSLTLTEPYDSNNDSGLVITMTPSHPKRYQNRTHLIAGHALRFPTTTVASANNVNKFEVVSATDFFIGAEITVGTYITRVISVSSNVIGVFPSLPTIPAPATNVYLSSIWNVYLNEKALQKTRDYTYVESTAVLTLTGTAEFNIADVKSVIGTVSFNSTTAVTGTNTVFTEEFKPGDWISNINQGIYFEVLSVNSETSITLRTAASYTVSAGAIRKQPDVYKQEDIVLSCDVIGATKNGLTTGEWIKTGPEAVNDILSRIGLSDILLNFDEAAAVAPQRIGMVIPEKVNDKKTKKARDYINKINESVFGSLFQTNEFKLWYKIIDPSRADDFIKFIEADVLKMVITSDSSKIVKNVVIEYLNKEFDSTSLDKSFNVKTATSETGEYLARTDNEFRLSTVLLEEADATIYAQRWAFLREYASAIVKMDSSLKAARMQIHDRIKLVHEKLYHRLSATDGVKLAGVSKITRDGSTSSLEIDDLGNAYNRCATITENSANPWSTATDEQKLLNGYITDEYGMINNDANTFGVDLIW